MPGPACRTVVARGTGYRCGWSPRLPREEGARRTSRDLTLAAPALQGGDAGVSREALPLPVSGPAPRLPCPPPHQERPCLLQRPPSQLWRAGGGAGPAVPLWKVPGAGRLEYRSKTPPPDRTRRCLTTSVLALERKVMPDSFLHVFLHVSLPQSSSISPRRQQCCEGPGSPTWAAARWPWGRLSSVLTLPRTGRETLSDREHD